METLHGQMFNEGYGNRAPSSFAAVVDGHEVDQMRCPLCGSAMQYEPFVKRGSYRAFAVCMLAKCGHEVEL